MLAFVRIFDTKNLLSFEPLKLKSGVMLKKFLNDNLNFRLLRDKVCANLRSIFLKDELKSDFFGKSLFANDVLIFRNHLVFICDVKS